MLFYIAIVLLIIMSIGNIALGVYLHYYEKKYGWNIEEKDTYDIFS
jgi:hypothetical protein